MKTNYWYFYFRVFVEKPLSFIIFSSSLCFFPPHQKKTDRQKVSIEKCFETLLRHFQIFFDSSMRDSCRSERIVSN